MIVQLFLSGINQTYDPYQESLMQEECILVDENDQATGQASKRICHTIDPSTGTSPLHRAFSLFIFNNENKLLLQQRLANYHHKFYDVMFNFIFYKIYISSYFVFSDLTLRLLFRIFGQILAVVIHWLVLKMRKMTRESPTV